MGTAGGGGYAAKAYDCHRNPLSLSARKRRDRPRWEPSWTC